MTINIHCVRKDGEKLGVWDNLSDKFPLQTYRGNPEQILKCLEGLFSNSQSGINKVVVLLDDDLPEAQLGQAPQQLED